MVLLQALVTVVAMAALVVAIGANKVVQTAGMAAVLAAPDRVERLETLVKVLVH